MPLPPHLHDLLSLVAHCYSQPIPGTGVYFAPHWQTHSHFLFEFLLPSGSNALSPLPSRQISFSPIYLQSPRDSLSSDRKVGIFFLPSHPFKTFLAFCLLLLFRIHLCQVPSFRMFKLVLEKAEDQEIKLPTSTGSPKKQESSRKTSISALLTMPKPLTVWITINCGKFWKTWEYQTTWPASWETYKQVRRQQLDLDMEQQTGSK